MTTGMVMALKSGALTGGATLLMQAVNNNGHWTPFDALVPIVSAIVGAAVAYGVLKATVTAMAIEIRDLKTGLSEIRVTQMDSLTRVARIEGALHRHHNPGAPLP